MNYDFPVAKKRGEGFAKKLLSYQKEDKKESPFLSSVPKLKSRMLGLAGEPTWGAG